MKKKIAIIILFLITLTFNVIVAKATSFYATESETRMTQYAIIYNSTTTWWFKDYMNGNDTTYVAFCQNSAIDERAGGTFLCSPYSTSSAYAAGMKAIISNGYASNTTVKEQSATAHAVWLFNFMFKDKIKRPGYDQISHARFITTLNWLGQIVTSGTSHYQSEIHTKLKTLKKYGQNVITSSSDINITSYDSPYCNFYSNASSYNFSGFSTDTTTETEVYRLLKIGLDAAINYVQNGGSTEATLTQTSTTPKISTKTNITTSTTTKVVSYNFTATNFSSTGYINATFTCSNCSTLGISYTFYINGTNVGTSLSGINFLDYLSSSGTFTLRIEFTYSSEKSLCDVIKYAIDFSYKDPSFTADIYECIFSDSSQSAQDFLIMYNGASTKELKVSSADVASLGSRGSSGLAICNGDCEYLESKCSSKNTAACTIFEEEYESSCVNCTAYINPITCSDTTQNLYITEGAVITDDLSENNFCKVDFSSVETNVLKCVVERTDAAGNSYIADSNEYCSISCKEDYHIHFPSIQNVNNGRYFSLTASIDGTKSCYTSKINTDAFLEDLYNASENVKTAYNAYSKSVTSANKKTLTSAISVYDSIISDYNSCTEWPSSMKYNFDPDIKFWYQEGYMNSARTDVLEAIGKAEWADVTKRTYYCDVNDAYTSCEGTSGDKTATATIFSCTTSGSSYTCSNTSLTYSLAKYVKAEISVSAGYITPTQFYAIYPTGSIVVAEADKEDGITNSEELTNKLPVSLKTTGGVYTYTLKIENLGEYYGTDKLGRIWGTNDNSVVHTILTDTDLAVCYNSSFLTDEVNVDGTYIANGVYVCAYKVDCPDCPDPYIPGTETLLDDPDDSNDSDNPSGSDDPGRPSCYPNCPLEIIPPTCEPPGCSVECPECIYYDGELLVDYRSITVSDLNPNDREIGYNWSYDEDKISSAIELKAYVTTKEIEKAGENIYDVDTSTGTASSGDSAITITLDSTLLKWIKEYNDEHEDDGGYSYNSLDCYDYTNGSSTYANIFCYSTFIDELIYDGYSDKISGIDNRIIGTNSSDSNKLRKVQTQDSGYWTTWSDAKWSISTTNSSSYYKSYSKDIGIGPSWK